MPCYHQPAIVCDTEFIVMLPQSATDSVKTPTDQISVILNWFKELKQRVPVR